MGESRLNKQRIALLTSIAGILLSFQNCGRSGFETVDEADLMSSGIVGASPGGKASAPVAFEVGLDAIAYNSCVPNNKNSPAYFTLRTTAGGARGGVKLSQEFLTAAQNQLRPILGNNQVLDVQYKELIDQTNEGMEVQVALRSATDFTKTLSGTTRSGVWGAMSYLSHDSWLTPLVESARRGGNAYVPYSPRAPSLYSRLDFSFNQDFTASDYWNALGNAQGLRACAAQGCQGFGQFHVAVGFSEAGNRDLIRSPVAYNNVQSRAVGRGYQLQFGYPFNNTGLGMRVVKGIAEYNMSNGQPVTEGGQPSQWRCLEIPIMSPNQRGPAATRQTSSADQRFAAVDPNTVLSSYSTDTVPAQAFNLTAGFYRNLCNPIPGSFAVGFNQQLLSKLRELLPPSQWQLGFQNLPTGARLCAIPVGMDCYTANEQFPNPDPVSGQPRPYPYYVDYYPNSSANGCISEDNMATALNQVGAGAVNSVCAHYITVCTKQ